ncbi:MAG: tripartite tricarboxylate transporter substrate binding protein [Burkholderiales bacterium]|nr:tripartite tricarboxylate transporter substrate binding protein [Burkholderiales bacterium]
MLARLTVLLAAACLALQPGLSRALDRVQFVVGSNPGGGYDQTAHALAQAMQEAGVLKNASFDHRAGGGGAIALAHFTATFKADTHVLIIVGAAMVGAILQNKPPVALAEATPIARLIDEYSAFAVPANSPIRSMKDVVEMMKKDPQSVKWGGGSRGSVDQIAIAQIAKAAGLDVNKINYVPFQGGGEAAAAIAGAHVTVGTSGWNELAPLIRSGKLRAIAISSPARLVGNDTPTLREQGYDVEIRNWRGVYAARGLSVEQRRRVTRAVVAATQQKSWVAALEHNAWQPTLLTGNEFARFVTDEHTRIEAQMRQVGLLR